MRFDRRTTRERSVISEAAGPYARLARGRWLALVGSVGLVLAACQRTATPAAPPPPAVTVSTPVQREVTEWDVYTGRLAAVDTVDVRARVSGYVERAPFQEGATIKQGDLLFQIDVRPYQAQLDNAQGQVVQAEAQLKLAQANLARGKQAVGTGALTAEELQTRQETVHQNEGSLASAKAAVETARLNVEWCRVTAPIGGRISRKYVTPGNLITGGTAAGTLLTTITSVDPIYVYLDVDERSVLRYRELIRQRKFISVREAKVPCYLGLANQSDFPREGYLDFVDNRVNPSTGTLTVRGVFANPDGFLSPGFFARVRIARTREPNALLVSDQAIGNDQNRKYVVVVDADDIARPRPVKLGIESENMRVITEGLTPKDRVVVNGLLRVRPNQKVAPQEAPMPHGPSMPASPPMTASHPATAPGGHP